MDHVDEHSNFLFFFFFIRKLWKNIHFLGREDQHFASGDLFPQQFRLLDCLRKKVKKLGRLQTNRVGAMKEN